MLLAALAGAALGILMTSPGVLQPAREVFGEAWVADGESARGTLAGLLGVQITLIGLVLSASTAALYGLLANQSPRLTRFITPTQPLFHALIGFAVTTGYVLAAVRRLGPPELEAPRPVVTVGIVLAVTAVAAVIVDAALSLQMQQIDRVLHIVTRATRRAIEAERARTEAPSPTRVFTEGDVRRPVRAHRSGYVVGFDAAELLRIAALLELRVRLDRALGDYAVIGEPVGWLSARSPPPPFVVERIADAVLLDDSRNPHLDVGAGLRVLVDIAERALSPGVNDPYTACEVLYRLRALLTELGSVPDGDWLLHDDEGTVRVAIARPSFEELLRRAVDGPLRYASGDPDVLDAVLDVAATVGRIPSRREPARRLVARVLDDATTKETSPELRVMLETKARIVLANLDASAVIPRLLRDSACTGGRPAETTAVVDDDSSGRRSASRR